MVGQQQPKWINFLKFLDPNWYSPQTPSDLFKNYRHLITRQTILEVLDWTLFEIKNLLQKRNLDLVIETLNYLAANWLLKSIG